jgi:hypothetical protein
VAHHADHATASGDGYHGSTPDGRYTPTSAAHTFTRDGESADTSRVTCTRCLTETPAQNAGRAGDDLVCDQCQPAQPAAQPDIRKE